MITFNDIFYFESVARLHSFSAAADELYISHQMLSASIAKMETYLGEKLFDRSTRRVTLTPTGEYAYQIAQRVVVSHNKLKTFSMQSRPNVLDILYMPQIPWHEILIHRAKQQFSLLHPQINCNICSLTNPRAINLDDYAFVFFCPNALSEVWANYPRFFRDFKIITFHSDPYCLVINEDLFALKQRKKTVSIGRLLIKSSIVHKSTLLDAVIKQLEAQGYLIKNPPESKDFVEDMLSTVMINPRCCAVVPQILLKQYANFDALKTVNLGGGLFTEHNIAYNTLRIQAQPDFHDFLNVFLNQISKEE